jgi:hypothetical protein
VNQPQHSGEPHPWYREPLMWFVVGLPLTVVVAAFITLYLAARGGDDVVRDDFRKDGLAIYVDPARDAAAAAAGAHARLVMDAVRGRIQVTVTLEQGAPPETLLVLLSHATQAEFDRLVTLHGTGGRYEGGMEALPGGHWYVEITPADRSWRLRSDFQDSATAIELAPGVS